MNKMTKKDLDSIIASAARNKTPLVVCSLPKIETPRVYQYDNNRDYFNRWWQGHQFKLRHLRDRFGGMLSVRVAGGAPGALSALGRLRIWKRATSLGGVESLVEHRASVEGPQTKTAPDLLRMSVGLEDTGDLIADLESAFG